MAKAIAQWLWHRVRSEQAFFLPEALLGIVVSTMTALMVARGAALCLKTADDISAQGKLQSGGRHLFSMLEHDLSYEAVRITIQPTKNVSLKTISANKQITLSMEKGGVYRRTRTGAGSGMNPLCNEGVMVRSWQVKKIDEHQLAVHLVLEVNGRQQEFYRLFYCANGEVVQNG